MQTFRGLVLVVVGALALATVPATGAFADPPPACGTTLTASVRLSADLECRGGTALYVGADGITIDLGGHYLKGDGTGTGIAGAGSTRYRDVAVTGGIITNFE